jgi:cellulose synthase (UDP-forming)
MTELSYPGRRERLTRVVAATSLAFSTGYIVWRWGWTLNTDALWFSVPLALAETYGLLTAFFLTFTGWKLRVRASEPPLRDRTVDVFVTTYDEPLAIIRKTALAARGLTYPHETWILDDGRRDEVEAMARELGVRYLRRDNNEHAKAGNLNNALRQTHGEFILQLDADHVPLPHMIDRLIGFFAEDRLAFVQSPQDFYNTDAFTYEVDAGTRRLWEDQQLFFRVLQPGKDRVNAAFFVGSCALIRRAAIDDIGGFATRTITEDIETSLLLHSRGWKSAYYGESLAYGLAPSNAAAFHVQHLRWGQGAMQALRHYGPLRLRGLTLAQRIAYFDSLTTYLGGFQRLILYLAPIVFFMTGVFPLETSAAQFAAVFGPYIVLQFVSFKLLARGNGSLLLADRFAMSKFFTHIRSVTGYLTRRRLRFRVTPKGLNFDVPPVTYAPQLMLVIATVGALAFTVYERTWGFVDEVPGWGSAAVWVNVVFALWNAWVAASIVRTSFAGNQQRAGYRFAESLPVAVRILRGDGRLAAMDIAVTGDLSPQGTALRCMHPIEDDAWVEMTLPLSRAEVPVRGRLVNRREQTTPYGTVYVHGIEFENLDVDARDTIELHCAQHATPLERQRYAAADTLAAGTLRRLRNIRVETRVSVGMPAEIRVGEGAAERPLGLALLEDISPRGARIVIDHPIANATFVRVNIPGTTLETSGTVVFVHALETSLGMRFVIGIDTTAETPEMAVSVRWYQDVLRLATRYGVAARTLAARSRELALASGRRVLSALPRLRPVAGPRLAPGAPIADAASTIDDLPEGALVEAIADAHLAVGGLAAEAAAMERAEAQQLVIEAALPPALDDETSSAGELHGDVDLAVEQASAADDALADSQMVVAPAELSAAVEAVDQLVTAAVALEIEDAEVLYVGEAEGGDFEGDARYAEVMESQYEQADHAFAPPEGPDAPYHTLTTHLQGADTMPSVNQSLVPLKQSDAPAPVLFTVRGHIAQIEGAFADAESVEIHGDVSGDLRVGGLLVIGEQANVSANATAANIRVEGEFTGDLRATECVEITASGTVNGSIKCDELVIERGGVFNGTATRTARAKAQAAAGSTRDRYQSRQDAPRADAARQEASRADTPRAPLADIATPPATSVLDFSSDDDGYGDQSRGQGIPLA